MYIFYEKEDFRGKIGNQKYVGDSKWLKSSILALFIKINSYDFISPFYIHSIDFRHGTNCESDGDDNLCYKFEKIFFVPIQY